MKSRTFYFIFLLFLTSTGAYSQQSSLLRISLENTVDHIQTQYVMKFAELVEERTEGSIIVEFYHSGMLYRDQEVINALYTGKVEMAVPGTWHISAHVPEISYFLLPEFFGEEREYNYEYINSEEGQRLISRIEETLNVVIPGDWLDLGHAVIFTTKRNRIRKFRDLVGKTIRVAGGTMNKRRVELLGADGVIIAWPDVPYHLRKGTIDGLLTTFESVKSAELWEYGVKYAFVDNEYFPQYIPMISKRFWEMISSEEQSILISTWNEIALEQREEAEKAQIEARKVVEENGISVFYPQEEDLNEAKSMLMEHQQELIEELMY